MLSTGMFAVAGSVRDPPQKVETTARETCLGPLGWSLDRCGLRWWWWRPLGRVQLGVGCLGKEWTVAYFPPMQNIRMQSAGQGTGRVSASSMLSHSWFWDSGSLDTIYIYIGFRIWFIHAGYWNLFQDKQCTRPILTMVGLLDIRFETKGHHQRSGLLVACILYNRSFRTCPLHPWISCCNWSSIVALRGIQTKAP